MTSYFSWLADDLTEIEERLSEPDLAPYSAALRRAINRAFLQACEADRAQRQDKAAPPGRLGIKPTPMQVVPAPTRDVKLVAESRTFAGGEVSSSLPPAAPGTRKRRSSISRECAPASS